MGIGRIFKRIALIIAILGIIGVILFIVLISLIRLDFRSELAPISKKEKELFEEIEQETGFVADTTSRIFTKERCCNHTIEYSIDFYLDENNRSFINKEEKHINSILEEKSINLYKIAQHIKLDKNQKMYFCIKYHKEKESTYLYFIEKTDTYVLYNWNKKDTIFLK